ncbi:hypothetical protein CIW82_14665 [Acetobacter tropicalis]|uniref:DUF1826 domain-containing protein n=2 Tax=Acetobacter tropicalis TaxID=104102 RepID=A0A291PK22_9PROT|nr:hypothetical protein CIW82_14665 [Acetobacter tropicalis]
MLSSPCPTRLSLFQNAQADIHSGKEPMTILARPLSATLQAAIEAMIKKGPRLILAKGTPEDLRTLCSPHMPPTAFPLLEDALHLAQLYREASGLDAVRFRLEQITTDSCRKFHTDHVALRLLCTYYGPGTEWLSTTRGQTATSSSPEDDPALIHRIPAGHIALLEGNKGPHANSQGVVHRSPRLSHLPMSERLRVLLTIDEPTACGMADEHNPTVRP